MKKTAVVALAALAATATVATAAQGISGTQHHSGVEDGTAAYIKAIEAGAAGEKPEPGVQAGQASFEGGEAAYSLPGLADGSYTLCLFIDVDGNVQQTMGTTSGDYGMMKPATVEGETTLDVAESEWMQMP
jgi:hypothetical protein